MRGKHKKGPGPHYGPLNNEQKTIRLENANVFYTFDENNYTVGFHVDKFNFDLEN